MTPLAHVRRIRPAVLLAGGAALLGVAQAFLPVLRLPTSPPPSRIHHPITPATAAPPTPTPESPPATPDLSQALALGEHGDYAAGVALALALPEDRRPAALASLFTLWTAEDAAASAHAALALAVTDTSARDIAWHAVVSQWALADPAGLAALTRDLPAAAPRDHALAEAVRHWLERDSDAARAWVAALPAVPENDPALAAVAEHPDLIRDQPALALTWAESIHDPALRSRTLGRVVREWREAAPAAAETYARRAPDIFPAEREDILVGERFTAHP